MTRWEPDARERLERAALDLFAEHGFDHATVPDITARAGLTTRTFFRHFADKREVLFADADRMPLLAATVVHEADPELAPWDVVRGGLVELIASVFDGRREQLLRRKAVIDSHDGLRERELRKMEAVVDSVTAAFRARGVDPLTAAVVAETAIALVKVSLRRWLSVEPEQPLRELLDASLDALARTREPGHPSPATPSTRSRERGRR
ncbi:TetR family transcriptional regulator [Jatrophihabitans sp. YIM 134969]